MCCDCIFRFCTFLAQTLFGSNKTFKNVIFIFCALFFLASIQYFYNIPLIYINNITNNFSSCTLMLVCAAPWSFGHWRPDRCSTVPLLSQHFGRSGLPVRLHFKHFCRRLVMLQSRRPLSTSLCLVQTPNCEDRGNLTPHRAIIKVLNMAQSIQL